MRLGPRPEAAGVIDSIPSLPVESSVLFVLLAGLFLVALMLRAQRLPRKSQPETMTTGAQTSTRAREGTMSQNMQHGAAAEAAPENQQFRIHWDRTLLAGIALLALLAVIGTSLAAGLTSMAWTVPAICAAVFLGALVGLQVTAAARRRRKRHQRVERAMQDAISAYPQADEQVAVRQRSAARAGAELGISSQSAPFDALSSDAAGQGGPDSLVTLDEDGLPENAERLFGRHAPRQAPQSEQQSSSPAGRDDSTRVGTSEWEPRQVPHPKYLVAEKAERPEPQPVESAQSPAPSADTKLQQPAAPAAPQEQRHQDAPAESAMDLDAVLKRRRA